MLILESVCVWLESVDGGEEIGSEISELGECGLLLKFERISF